MTVAVRFAPSPTGLLHVGNARLALVNWLVVRKAGGSFLLRLDDTDAERSEERYARAIERDLAWLGLDWDRFVRQSDRLDRYADAVARLKASGRLYPAYETAEELALNRRRQLAAGRPPVYDRAALAMSDADRARLEAEGRRPHWRFRLDHHAVAWDDLVQGPKRFAGQDLGDPVLLREDGVPLYTLSSVVDDIDTGITHVVRGEDHVANTAVQIQLFQALGAAVPVFAHLPLMTDAAGQGLSKRLGSISLEALRAEGIEPMALASLLARIGTSDPVEPRPSLDVLAQEFAFEKVSRAPARFDAEELRRLNARVVHGLSWANVADRLDALGCTGADADFWEAVRPNVERVEDAALWWRIVAGPVEPVLVDEALTARAAALLPPEPWDETVWGAWTDALKRETGLKGRALFKPLRLALTGLEHGPELQVLLPLIGRERARLRLSGQRA